MMTRILKITLAVYLLVASELCGQTSQTTVSKNCGSCGKQVSKNSRVGMTCPHCHVRWGYENSKKTTSTSHRYTTAETPRFEKYKSKSSLQFTKSNVNLRKGPSTKSAIIDKLSPYTAVTVLSTTGDWSYVEYTSFEGFELEKRTGYIHSSLIE